MNLGEIRTRLTDVYGSTLSSEEDFLNRIINDAYMKLCVLSDWWWLEDEWAARFSAYVTDISVTATKGSGSVTSSTTLDSAYDEGWLWTGEHLYRINSISGTTISLDAEWIEDSGSYTVTVWNDMLDLPSDCDRVVEILCRNAPNRKPLRQVDIADIEAFGPNVSRYRKEIADRFAIFKELGRTTSQRIRIFPPPSEVAEYGIRYRILPSELTSDSSEPIMPSKYHRMLCELAIADLLTIEREDPDLIAVWQNKASLGMSRMMAEQHQRGGKANLVVGGRLTTTNETFFRLINTDGGV